MSKQRPYTYRHPSALPDILSTERHLRRSEAVRRLHPLGDLLDLRIVEQARPFSLRAFDQIPMHGSNLLQQAQFLAPALADKHVAFMGDSDCLSLMIGLLGRNGRDTPRPAAMHLLDFDERLLSTALDLAVRHGFSELLHTWRYNVFDPIPTPLAGSCDIFVTNPPYGMYNKGKSARLFIGRAMELITPDHGEGAIILPDDPTRPWTGQAYRATLGFLNHHGWVVHAQYRAVHKYHLDDDPSLASDLILVGRTTLHRHVPLKLAGQRVGFMDIPNFYGRSTKPPFPRYILRDGTPDFSWDVNEENIHEWRHPTSGFAA